MNRFKLLFFVIFIVNLYKINALLSDKRLCADEECKVPISLAKTLIRYASPEPGVLSFAPNDDVTIYSKSAGSRTDLWGAEIKGKRGYVPHSLVREVKLLQHPKVLVQTEVINETRGAASKQVPLQVEPDKVQEPYEVVDGTTIYDINPTITESSVHATAIPPSSEISTEEEDEEDDDDDDEADVDDDVEEEEDQEDGFFGKIFDGVMGATTDEEKKPPPKEELLKNIVPLSAKLDSIVEHVQENVEISSSLTAKSNQASEAIKMSEDVQEAVSDHIRVDETTLQQSNMETTTLSSEMDIPQPIDLVDEVTENPLENFSSKEAVIPQLEDLAEEITENPLKNVRSEEQVITTPASLVDDALSKEEQIQSTVPPLGLFNHVSQEVTTETVLLQDPVQSDEAAILNDLEELPLNSIGEPQKVVENLNNPTAEIISDNLSSVDNASSETANLEKEKISIVQDAGNVPLAENVGLAGEKQEPEVQVSDDLLLVENATEIVDSVQENLQSDAQGTSNEPLVKETFENIDENVNEKSQELEVEISNDLPLVETIVKVEDNQQPDVQLPNDLPQIVDNIDLVKQTDPIQQAPAQEETNIETPTIPEEQIDEPKESSGFFDGLFSHFTGNSQENEPTTQEQAVTNENIKEINEQILKEQDDLNEDSLQQELFGQNENEKEVLIEEKNTSEEVPKAEQALPQEIPEERSTDKTIEVPFEESKENLEKTTHTMSSSNIIEQCETDNCGLESTIRRMEKDEEILDFVTTANLNSDIFIYLATTAISVIIFLLGYLALDKSKREGPLVGKINKLEKEMLIILKENELLQERVAPDQGYETNDKVSSEAFDNLQQQLFEVTGIKNSLEEQVQSLEKELENSTEVGMELNRMLTEILSSESGSDVIKANVENLQRQLVEQQSTINSNNETLAIINTENYELKLELEITNKKVIDLQAELDKLLINILKIEEEKEIQQTTLESQIVNYKKQYDEMSSTLKRKDIDYKYQIDQLTDNLEQTARKLELKIKEHTVLADTLKQLKNVKNKDVSSLLEVTDIKAECQLLQTENERFREKLRLEKDMRCDWEHKAVTSLEEVLRLKEKYDESEKAKVEIETKLEVLSNYFKEREAQLQRDITKHESLWVEKQGEATSTTERIKFMQEQLQNYKSQTESLKQEIVSQEVELKSQISVLEKKVHENWVTARQAERKLEESKQEAAQLRHRLTLRERALQDDKIQRLQSPLDQNGDLESPASPPLLYSGREMMTKSPPINALPPFLPPPPGVPFMPPPLHGVPPFIPPPPNMFPGDHRPPPLGRMSSPPLNSRYSPSSRGYSPYDRNSSSPSDSEYGASPPHRRAYSPFNIREYTKRGPPGRTNGRDLIKGGSSGSGHSNESLEKINRQPPKV